MTDNISVSVASSVLNLKKDQCLRSVDPAVDVNHEDSVLGLSCTQQGLPCHDDANRTKSSLTQCHKSHGWIQPDHEDNLTAGNKNVNGDCFIPCQVSISQKSDSVSPNSCCSNKDSKSIISKPDIISNQANLSLIKESDCDVNSKHLDLEFQKLNGVSHVSCSRGENGLSKYLLKEFVGEKSLQGVNVSCPQQTDSSHSHYNDTHLGSVKENLCDKNDTTAPKQLFSVSATSASTSRENVNELLGGIKNVSLHGDQQPTNKSYDVIHGVTYIVYESEKQMPDIMRLITKDLSEPYSIYTYRYFIHNWPKLCFLAEVDDKCVGAIVCKLDLHKKMVRRGYIAMLAVDSEYRRRQIGSTLVTKAIQAMIRDDCDEVVLETEITNLGALHLYENLGFVRDKRLFRYYLNGVDALRLKLWLR